MTDGERRRAGSGGFVPGALGLSATAFALLRDLVAERTGVYYSDERADLLVDRVAELVAARGLPSLLDYYYLLKYDPAAGEAWAQLRDRLAVPETYFWRQPDQFEALAEVLAPRYHATLKRPLRVWSAACCTGEEPLSIAMALDAAGWFRRMSVEIVGSDASPAMVERAREGRYGDRALRNLPDGFRERYFRHEGGAWRVDPALHARVRWTTANLMDPDEAGPLAESDVVFCRNVLIYFSDDGIRRVARLFAERMPPTGHLFLGASESLMRLSSEFVMQEVGPAFVYVRAEAARAPERR